MLVILGSDSFKKVLSNLQSMKSGDSAPTGFSPMQVRVRLSPAVSRYCGNSVWLKNGAVCGVWCVEGVVECVCGCGCSLLRTQYTLSEIINVKFPKQFPNQHCHYAILYKHKM